LWFLITETEDADERSRMQRHWQRSRYCQALCVVCQYYAVQPSLLPSWKGVSPRGVCWRRLQS